MSLLHVFQFLTIQNSTLIDANDMHIMSQWSVLLCLFPWLGMLRTMSKWRGQKLILED